MFHLVGKVFLKLETEPYTTQPRAVISSEGVFPMEVNLENVYPEKLRMKADHVSDIYPHRIIELMDEAVKPEWPKGFTIYCCPESYRTLAAAWYKALFPNITLELFLLLFKTQSIKDEFCPIDFDSRGGIQNEAEIITEQQAIELYDTVEESLELRAWVKARFSDLSEEYLLLSYLKHGNYRPFLRAAKQVANKTIRTLINDAKYTMAVHAHTHPECEREAMAILPTGWDHDLPRVGPQCATGRFKSKTTQPLDMTDRCPIKFTKDLRMWLGEVLGYRDDIVERYMSLLPLTEWFGDRAQEVDLQVFLDYLRAPYSNTSHFVSSSKLTANIPLIHRFLDMSDADIAKIEFIY